MSRRGRALASGLVVLVLAGACAKRVAPPIPESEDYVFPAPEPGALDADGMERLRSAWRDVLAGDIPAARKKLETARRRAKGGLALETALGYAALRAGNLDQAEALFAAALGRSPDFVPALVGAGSVASRRGDAGGALAFYRRALAASPADALARKRVAALKLQLTERHMTRAQEALAGGDTGTAAEEYRTALETAPEVTGVRLALADLLARGGDREGALATLAADPVGDRQVRLKYAEVLLDAGRFEAALEVYRDLLARDAGDGAARAGYGSARERWEAALMPEEYRRIPGAAQLTRADLAALLVVRVKGLRRAAAGDARVAVDISGSWAREQIIATLALDLMDVYPNHTFQPGAIVRRVDLARAAARVLDRLALAQGSAPGPTDVPRSHLDYDAVRRVLGTGLMSLTPGGAFEPWRIVTGREALDVVDALARLVGP